MNCNECDDCFMMENGLRQTTFKMEIAENGVILTDMNGKKLVSINEKETIMQVGDLVCEIVKRNQNKGKVFNFTFECKINGTDTI